MARGQEPKQPKKRGRPSSYKPEYAKQAAKLCRLGATDKQLADFFGIAESTLNNWKIEHPEFMESLKSGKEVADAEVVNSLYMRATGYSHPDVHISNYQGQITVTPITKQYAPDTTACIFWLKNRRPDLWRDHPAEGGAEQEPLKQAFTFNVVDGRTNGDPD